MKADIKVEQIYKIKQTENLLIAEITKEYEANLVSWILENRDAV